MGLFGREKPFYNAVLQIRRDTEDNSEINFLMCIFQQNLCCDPSLKLSPQYAFMENMKKYPVFFFSYYPFLSEALLTAELHTTVLHI